MAIRHTIDTMDVWKAIEDNRQWIFDGIGVLAIGAIGKVLYSHFKKSGPATVQQGTTGVGHVVNVNAPVAGSLTLGDAVAGHSAAPPQKSKTITAREIQKAIAAAPQFQQDEMAKFYYGQPIDWDCRFWIIHKRGDDKVGLTLVFNSLHSPTCYCVVPLSEYPQLKVIADNTPVRIIGTVGWADVNTIGNKDPKLYF